MPLTAPNLDDRSFQDLVDEAKKRIPQYCEEWTDHNVSDPGITLIELFAWMTDILLYRLNQVPDRHYIEFMNLLGMKLQAPQSARVPVTFWLSTPPETTVRIPAGTEVSSTQTENEGAIIFTTESDLIVENPQFKRAYKSTLDGDKRGFEDINLRRLTTGFNGIDVFSEKPKVGDALYFGFENDVSHHILGFDMDFDTAGGAGIDPAQPPYVWEASDEGVAWLECRVELDTTGGMNHAGKIRIHLPQMSQLKIEKKELYWVRVRIKEISSAEKKQGMRDYDRSPRIRQANVVSWGGSIPAVHARLVQQEFLGKSDGSPGQRLTLKRKPLLQRQSSERLLIQVDGQKTQDWQEVGDFSLSGAQDPHYTLDSLSGELRLGPAVRQPDGTMKLYGAVPPRGANLVFSEYYYGGGQIGNVQTGVINTLKTSIPFVSRVANLEPAWGGLDAESLEAAITRAPAVLHSRDRAVTPEDFEYLARQALPKSVGRVKCLQPTVVEDSRVPPGQIYVLVIPRQPQPAGFMSPDDLRLGEGEITQLTEYLDERRLLTTRLDIREPAYNWVSVRIQLRVAPGAARSAIENEVNKRLYRYLNPLTGGADGKGWEFGRDIYLSDVFQCLQGLANVLFIRNVEMYSARPGGGPQGDPVEMIDIVMHGVVASGTHVIEFI